MRQPDTALAAAMLGVFVVMVAVASGYPFETRLMPIVIGVPAASLAAWQLWREATGKSGSGDKGADEGQIESGREVRAVGWLSLLTLIVTAFGFVAGGTLAVAIGQRFWLGESWRTALLSGVAAFVVIRVCFEFMLGLPLFGGWVSVL